MQGCLERRVALRALGARYRLIGALVLVNASACSPTLPPPEAPPRPAAARATEHANLLLYPQTDASSLLGRAVHRTEDGVWTIADELAPGCEVSVSREKAAFHSSRRADAHSMTSLSGGYAQLVSLVANFGRSTKVDIDVDNTEVLHGNTRGACGEYVVDKVFVGHGKRSIQAQAASAANANLQIGVISANPKLDTGQTLVDSLEWQDDQAYGFGFRTADKSEPLSIKVDLPAAVLAGDDVTVHFSAKREAWLVVYYLSEGKADVLWPSVEEPAPHVAPNGSAVLPSPRETAAGFRIRAALAKPGTPSRETLVVYGFSNEADFERLKPAAGAESADGAAYAAELTSKLQTLPLSRWSRSVISYVIEPRTR